MSNRWLRPEVYPLFGAIGVAVTICCMQLIRNICTNPEVRLTKENRTAGVLENYAEGEKYAKHSLRKFVRGTAPEIMPSINSFFTDPEQSNYAYFSETCVMAPLKHAYLQSCCI